MLYIKELTLILYITERMRKFLENGNEKLLIVQVELFNYITSNFRFKDHFSHYSTRVVTCGRDSHIRRTEVLIFNFEKTIP